MTLENWQEILVACFRSSIFKGFTIFYLISWIFIGNYILLNLLLAILLDAFTNDERLIDEIDFFEDKSNLNDEIIINKKVLDK